MDPSPLHWGSRAVTVCIAIRSWFDSGAVIAEIDATPTVGRGIAFATAAKVLVAGAREVIEAAVLVAIEVGDLAGASLGSIVGLGGA
jgi:hypothetical protein